MSKKRRRTAAPVALQPARPARPARRRVAIAVLSLAVLLAAGAIVLRPGGRNGTRTLPAARAPLPDSGASFGDFLGSAACAQCHEAQYAAWSGSTHGRAGAAPPDGVIAPFDGRPIRFRDAVVTPSRAPNGGYTFTVTQPARPTQVFRVAAVVGGGHMVGGGTQSFFTDSPDGTLRFLPFDYIRREGTWFCNTNGRSDRGWVPITPALAIAECGDWPPGRVFGGHARFDNCQQCHGSQIQLAFDPAGRRYDTRFTSLAINCESCHGPGRRHVALARSGRIRESGDIGMAALATLDEDGSLAVCFQCHAVKEELRPGYLPGRPFDDYLSLGGPVLTARPHFPDGRIRFFAYQETHRYSDCYVSGSMTCVSCHDPHSQRYRDVNDRPLADRFSDGQCLGCHPSKAAAIERHTKHQPGSAGSRCVACHMPYLQQPNVGTALRYARSDHAIPIPRPAFDAGLGIASACRQCHAGRSPESLDAQVRAWYGELKPHPDLVTGLLEADRTGNRVEEARRLLTNDARHAAVQLAALSHFSLHQLRPDMTDLEPQIVERLERLAESADLDVRALALAGLHLAAGERGAVWRFLSDRLRSLGADEAAVRARWVAALDFRGDAYLGQRDFPSALAAYRKARQLAPDDPAVLANVAAGYANTGDYARAVDYFRASLARDSDQVLTLASLAVALGQTGDWAGAMAAYQRALAIDPREPSVHLSLGNAYLRQGQLTSAVGAYQRAVALDPSLADAWFALARASGQLGRTDEAITALRRGLEFNPGNAGARAALEQLVRASPR